MCRPTRPVSQAALYGPGTGADVSIWGTVGTGRGCSGVLVTGGVSGLAAGPLLPLDTPAHVAQQPQDWLIRLAFFVVVGQAMALVVGVTRDQARVQNALDV
jgi:hypothetical protein